MVDRAGPEAEAIKKVLQNMGFLEYISPKDLERLISESEKGSMVNGEVLIHQGKPGGIFYLLETGSVNVFLKRAFLDKKLAALGPNSFFGEMSLITGEPSGAEVVCEEEGVFYTFLKETFRNTIMANPHLALVIQKTALKRKADIANLGRDEASK